MSSVNAPLPLVLIGGGLCVLAGFLIGVVVGPDAPSANDAVVSSYDARTRELCLQGDQISGMDGSDGDTLCGVWNRGAGSRAPRVGDDFRFLTLSTAAGPDSDQPGGVLIYGDVVE